MSKFAYFGINDTCGTPFYVNVDRIASVFGDITTEGYSNIITDTGAIYNVKVPIGKVISILKEGEEI